MTPPPASSATTTPTPTTSTTPTSTPTPTRTPAPETVTNATALGQADPPPTSTASSTTTSPATPLSTAPSTRLSTVPPPRLALPLTPSSRAGRRPGPVWNYFTAVRTATNKTHATCNFCARRCAGVATRMTQHVLTKCAAAPADAIHALALSVSASTSTSTFTPTSTAASTSPCPLDKAMVDAVVRPSPAKRLKPTAMSTNAAPMSGRRGEPRPRRSSHREDRVVDVVQQRLTLACLRHDIPLSFLADADLGHALRTLRPAFPLDVLRSTEELHHAVQAAVARDTTRWLRASGSITLVVSPSSALAPVPFTALPSVECVLVDDHRHRLLLAHEVGQIPTVDMVTRWRKREELASLPPRASVGICTSTVALLDAVRAPAESSGHHWPLCGRCLVTESFALWRVVFEPSTIYTQRLLAAAALARDHMQQPPGRQHEPQRETLTSALSTLTSVGASHPHWSVAPRMVSALRAISPHASTVDAVNDEATPMVSSVDVASLQAVLTPLSWLLALSESREASSSQFVLLWLHLMATLSVQSQLQPHAQDTKAETDAEQEQCVNLQSQVLQVLRNAVEDHHLVALLLDPRVHGAGLSATGMRHVQALVVDVWHRLCAAEFSAMPAAAASTAASTASTASTATVSGRAALLEQLAQYVDHAGVFAATEVGWEMSCGRGAPEAFWRNYEQDAPELTRVALVVLTYVSHTRTASQYAATTMTTATTTATTTGPTTEVLSRNVDATTWGTRQMLYHFDQNDRSPQTQSSWTMAETITKYADVLLPDVVLPTPVTAPSTVALNTTSYEAAAVQQAMKTYLQVMTATEPERVDENDHKSTTGLALDASWLAVHNEHGRERIALAARAFVPRSLLARALLPSDTVDETVAL